MNVTLQKVRGAVFGAALGDAVGVPYEYKSPEEMQAAPATDMIGHGTYDLPIGTWSDDTTMILCTLDKLDAPPDYHAIMKAFLLWKEQGAYTPYGECFDIGTTTWNALVAYKRTGKPMESAPCDQRSNGNGSLMRIIPAALYADAHALSPREAASLSHDLSRLTHAHRRSQIGCGIFTFAALALLQHPDKSAVTQGLAAAAEYYSSVDNDRMREEALHYARVLDAGFADLPRESIKSSGYIVDTLECALWSLLNTDSFRDCILCAINFGRDTDTAACIAGALAGLLYGLEGIPSDWYGALAKPDDIDAIIQGFCERNHIL